MSAAPGAATLTIGAPGRDCATSSFVQSIDEANNTPPANAMMATAMILGLVRFVLMRL